ncbi:MAG: hypothetical protein ACRCZQ_00300 [Bacteroidales bacterium]
MKQQQNYTGNPFSKEQWEMLLEKYYDGDTSNEEESWLEEWLLNSQESSPEHNPDRAVKSWIAIRRKEKKSITSRQVTFRRLGYAAAIISVLLLSTTAAYHARNTASDEYYIVYAHNKKITDPERAFEQMHKAVAEVSGSQVSVENQLSAIFEGIDTEAIQ